MGMLMNLEASRGTDLASKLSEDTPAYTIGFATPCRCHSPRRHSEPVTQSNTVDLGDHTGAALPSILGN